LNFGPSAIGHPTPVGTYPDGKTPEGVFDMLGNVLEWIEDDWHEDYLQAPADGKAWVEQPRSQGRVLRGGCWDFTREHCRAGCRGGGRAEARSDFIGFRLAFTR
jgi:formylglycine-generating enzyme required for sulfatase activity